MNPPNILFVNQAFAHHSNVSGYQQVALRYPYYKNLFQLTPAKNDKTGMLEAHLDLFKAKVNDQLHLFKYASHRPKIELIHVLYGDMDLPLPLINYRNTPIVATFHQPASYLMRSSSRIKQLKKQLASLSAVVTLCQAQENLFSDLIGRSQVFTIPHGVDREFFKPSNKKREKTILIVGNWLRDWNFTLDVLEIIFSSHPEVSVRIISPFPHNPLAQKTHDKLFITQRLSDEELRLEYQRCGVVFFSFLDATANNAILEAAACGCRIVATDIGGVKDYIGDGAHLFKQDASPQEVASILVSELLSSSEQGYYQNLSSWDSVIIQLISLYKRLL